jgi:hypothetical protein
VRIGIPAATKLRKDELEKAIVVFLRTGNAALPTQRPLRSGSAREAQGQEQVTRRRRDSATVD